MTSILITYVGIHTFVHSVPPLKITCPVYHEQLWWYIFHFSCLTSEALLCSSSPTFHYPLRHLLYLLARYSSYVWVRSHTAADPFGYVTISSLYPSHSRLPCHFRYPSVYPKGAQGTTLSNATGWKSDHLVFHLLIWWNKAFHDYVSNFIDALNGQTFYSELLMQYMLNKINGSISEYFIPQNKQPITFS